MTASSSTRPSGSTRRLPFSGNEPPFHPRMGSDIRCSFSFAIIVSPRILSERSALDEVPESLLDYLPLTESVTDCDGSNLNSHGNEMVKEKVKSVTVRHIPYVSSLLTVDS